MISWFELIISDCFRPMPRLNLMKLLKLMYDWPFLLAKLSWYLPNSSIQVRYFLIFFLFSTYWYLN